jgi:CSLREA domain-containing protein
MVQTTDTTRGRAAVLVAALALLLALVPLASGAGAQEADGHEHGADEHGEHGEDGEDGDGDPRDVAVERLFGEDRFGTARVIALEAFGQSDTVVVASGQQFPDALAGSYLAGAFEAPVLLVTRTTAPQDTLDALEALEAAELILLGGDGAIGPDVEARLAEDYEIVDRFEGRTRFETSAAIATSGEDVGTWEDERTAILATGQQFADALVSGSVAFSEGFPVLLTPTAFLHPAASDALDELDIERVIVPGGAQAVSELALTQVRAKGIEVTRVSVDGGSRFDTSVAFAEFAADEFGYTFDTVNIATGFAYPDALTLGTKAGLTRTPLLLTNGTQSELVAATDRFLREHACTITALHIGGGTAAVSAANAEALAAAANDCADEGRVETFEVALSWINETDGAGAFRQGEPGADGTATLVVDEDANTIAFEVDYSEVTGPFDGGPGFHVHEGEIDENGPVVVFLATGAQLEAAEDQMLSATVDAGDFDVSELLDAPEAYYLNLHSDAFPAGAIRGQLPDGGQDQIPGADFRVTTALDTPSANAGDGECADAAGQCSLRAAIDEANASDERVSIVLPAGVYALTLAGPSEDGNATGDLDVTGDVVLYGSGATVDAAGLDRAIDVAEGAALDLRGLTVVNGAPPAGESGGALRNLGSLTVRDATIADSTALGGTASGGGIVNDGDLLVERSLIEGNEATRAGGGIESVAGSTTRLVDVDLIGNVTGPSPGNGGGYHITGAGSTEVVGGEVRDNVAANEGGGLWNSFNGAMTITGTLIDGNRAEGAGQANGGGGVFQQGPASGASTASLEITGATITSNVATGAAGSGGGILNVKGTLVVADTLIEGNSAPRAGGGIESTATTGMGDANVQPSTTRLTDVDLIGNTTGAAPGNGGGYHITGAGSTEVVGGEVRDNVAANEGGGLWNSGTGTMTVEGTRIDGNVAEGSGAANGGGGLFQQAGGGTLVVTDATITNNLATGTSGSGGGILNVEGDLTVTDTLIQGNSAPRAGGGIEVTAGSTTTLLRVQLLDNSTGANPGNGGGFHTTGDGVVTIDASVVLRNSAANEGGGLWNSATGTMTVTDTEIADNTAPTGPDVFNVGGTFTIDGEPVPPGR